MQMNDTIVFQIAKIFAVPDQSSVKIRKLSVQQQDGTVDCGAFAVAFATEFCFQSNPENVFFDQSLMRQHLYDCLDAGVMKRFPQCPKINNFLPVPKSTLFTIPVHCECRMPENFDTLMVACDVCNKWFHATHDRKKSIGTRLGHSYYTLHTCWTYDTLHRCLILYVV